MGTWVYPTSTPHPRVWGWTVQECGKSMFTSRGQTHTIISTKLVDNVSQLPHKRPHMDSFIDSANTQWVQHVNYDIAFVFQFQCLSLLFRFFDSSTDPDSLRYNTWKDKSQTRHHTAGTIIIRVYTCYQEYISNTLLLHVPIPTPKPVLCQYSYNIIKRNSCWYATKWNYRVTWRAI